MIGQVGVKMIKDEVVDFSVGCPVLKTIGPEC